MKKQSIFLYFFKSYLIIYGPKGRLVFDFRSKKSDSSVFLMKNKVFLVDFNKKTSEERLSSVLQNSVVGIVSNFSKKINLVGIGFRSWTVFENNKKFLIVKTSLSKDCIFYIPKTLDVFCLNPTTIFITGITRADVNSFVLLLKTIKKPNFYKQKGIFLENEIVKTKVGKKM